MNAGSDEIREVLTRAAQLEQTTPLGPADVETLLHAADEVGIPRAAVERALRERSAREPAAPAVGQLVFARSADHMYYVAEVTGASAGNFKVRFLRGGEHTISLEDLRPCSLLPGERVQVKWPGWGTWTGTVVSYDAARQQVTVSDGWSESRIFELQDVWINPRKSVTGPARSKLRAALIGAAAAGAAIGSALTALLLG